jgi:hypothetical protein
MNESRYGYHEFEHQVAVAETDVVSYKFSDLDADGKLRIPIVKDTLVLGVSHLVTKAFAGGVPALTIGDAVDADGFGAAAAFTLGTVGDFYSSQGGTPAFAAGKYFSDAGMIVLDHAAGLTAGEGKVLVTRLPLKGSWRTPDL